MRRRMLIAAPALWLTAGASLAQTPPRPARIGVLGSVPYQTWPRRAIFVEAMRERGWVEGTHYIVDAVVEDGSPEHRSALAADLVQRKPDLLLAPGTPAVAPLMKATRSIPIVFFAVGDPLGAGFVSNLARPGGNVTGLGGLALGLMTKQLELLHLAVPGARRIGAFVHPEFPGADVVLPDWRAAAARLGLELRQVVLRSPDELDAAFAALARERVEALHLLGQPFMLARAGQIAAWVAEQRLPSISPFPQLTQAGLLMSYNSSLDDTVRRVAYYIDRILKGTPPGEMAVEQPTRFYLTVNLMSASRLGLSLPRELLLRADVVIE
jgi:putative ABC transport system substrate-binding protein